MVQTNLDLLFFLIEELPYSTQAFLWTLVSQGWGVGEGEGEGENTFPGLKFWTEPDFNYFNVRNFRVQKFSRLLRMDLQFAKLNAGEIYNVWSFAKINSRGKNLIFLQIRNSRNFFRFVMGVRNKT